MNTTILTPPAAVASQANRAIGAMFFCLFGGAWLALWAHEVFVPPLAAYALIGCITLVFFYVVLRVYKLHAPALTAEPETQEKRRQSRNFHIVNTGQWVLLLIVANVLANIGLASWIIPAAILIIGAHFIPLARLFDYPPHYLTGAAMMLLAVAYPLIAPAGASNSVGRLGAGLILWTSAAWAITRTRSQNVA